MTEPLNKISGIKETSRNSSRGGLLKREKGKGHPEEAEDDNVDISAEARKRAAGKERGNTLEELLNEAD